MDVLRTRRGVAWDLLLFIITSAAVLTIASAFGLFARLYGWLHGAGLGRLEEIFILLLLAPVALILLAVRGGRELRAEIAERLRMEEALRRSNEKLIGWVEELEQRTHEINMLSELGNLLQTCRTADEAYTVLARSLRALFPAQAGSLSAARSSDHLLEVVLAWGPETGEETVFAPEDCWALRRGRLHYLVDAQDSPRCRHVGQSVPSGALCVPLLAQGELLGLLHVRGQDEPLTEAKRQLAVTVGEHISLALANLRLRETLRNQSIRDPLTGLFNRRFMEESLEREIRRAQRHRHLVGVILLDVDHFKRINDTYGHDAGDAVLRALAAFLKTSVRSSDVACRYGGEEFLLLLPEAPFEVTQRRAEELRHGVKQLTIRHQGEILPPFSISLGVATYPDHGTAGYDVVAAADAALYRAKAAGRDRAVVAQSSAGALLVGAGSGER
jgi:diguanylate cyclase (GGDEF)-like protein